MPRRTNDAYYTVDLCAAACVSELDLSNVRAFVEPSSGGGSFLRAMAGALPTGRYVFPIAVDVEARHEEAWAAMGTFGCGFHRGSFLDPDTLEAVDPVDLVVGNPPYLHAEAFVRRGLAVVRNGGQVAYLLRSTFLGSAERIPLFLSHPPRLIVHLMERPSFTGDGKVDMATYVFVVWERGWRGPTETRFLSWKHGAAPAAKDDEQVDMFRDDAGGHDVEE